MQMKPLGFKIIKKEGVTIMTPKKVKEQKPVSEKGRRNTTLIGVITSVSAIIFLTWGCTACQKNDYSADNEHKNNEGDYSYEGDNGETGETANSYEGGNSDSYITEEEELMCLIASELPHASIEVQTALAAVVYNRVEETELYQFATCNTVHDVINSPDQFESITEGKMMTLEQLKQNEALYLSTYNAVQAAKSGEDPTEGALFFFEVKHKTVPFSNGILFVSPCSDPDCYIYKDCPEACYVDDYPGNHLYSTSRSLSW